MLDWGSEAAKYWQSESKMVLAAVQDRIESESTTNSPTTILIIGKQCLRLLALC